MQKIAKSAGLEKFGSVESLSYTFKADLGERKIARSWTWQPKSGQVTLHGASDAQDQTYRQEQIKSAENPELAKLDHQFVNDIYWLIFPFQVVWDSGVMLTALPEAAAEVVPNAYGSLRVTYPDGAGYTPGDVYDLFYDKDYSVTHWVFRKGGSVKPSRISEWINYKDFGGLSISLNRPSPDGVRIWFDDVTVKLEE